MCPNGHVMDVSWDRCPYCPSIAPGAALAPATKEANAEPAPPPVSAKTEFMEVGKRSNDMPVVGWIVALGGNHKGQDFRIRDGKNRIGKGLDCDVVLTDKFLSTLHAHINYEMVGGEKKFILVDMDSTNGTFLNDAPERIHMEELIDNDKIRLGEVEFKFKCL
ncbi:MAG: FHA domain-containing protein [Planctomycetes bacterium]|nr:FHA domain-containing protein [Planctomycetota bacterium]